jgi:hypothetical protein
MEAGVVVVGRDPSPCGGPIDQAAGWQTSDPTVLRLDGAGRSTAKFLGVAPGTAQVFAVMPRPGGGTASVELSVCESSDADDKACARRPLVVRVVP